MKKISILALGLMTFASVSAVAQTEAKQEAVATTETTAVASAQDEKTAIKAAELPEAVQTTLKGDAYKDWTVSTVSLLKAKTEYYEVALTKEKETKTVKFTKEGTILQ